jgi:hypothetical protein
MWKFCCSKKQVIFEYITNATTEEQKKLNHSFDAIQQIGKGLVPLSMNSLLNLVLLVFFYHSVVDKKC